MRKRMGSRLGGALLLWMALAGPAMAQTGWFERSDRIKEEQPHWITPLATTTPRLEQEFRYDVFWQQIQKGQPPVRNFGGGKGLELIPYDNVEVIVGVPAYIDRPDGPVSDGFGDFRLLLKYRLAAGNEEHGNYIATAFLDVSFPTGSAGNGQARAVIAPTFAYGKGFGRFDVQGTFAAALPTDSALVSRTYTWNNALQYQVFRRFWPEVEVNATWFRTGRDAGMTQVFVTPGLVIGRLRLTRRVGFTVGAGVQIPVTDFRTSEHTAILSVRLPF